MSSAPSSTNRLDPPEGPRSNDTDVDVKLISQAPALDQIRRRARIPRRGDAERCTGVTYGVFGEANGAPVLAERALPLNLARSLCCRPTHGTTIAARKGIFMKLIYNVIDTDSHVLAPPISGPTILIPNIATVLHNCSSMMTAKSACESRAESMAVAWD